MCLSAMLECAAVLSCQEYLLMAGFLSCFARICCLLVDEEASGASMMVMSSDVSDLRLRERAVPVDGTMASRYSLLLEAGLKGND